MLARTESSEWYRDQSIVAGREHTASEYNKARNLRHRKRDRAKSEN